jgi:ABC-type uncharacterized transport system substrate-binding protein
LKLLHSRLGILVVLPLVAGCSGAPHASRPIIGVVQVSSLVPLDQAREGFCKALADSGFVRDVNVTFLERNAQGDIPTLSLIMREFVQQGATQVATLSSIATQTAMKAITDRPIIFGAVANPYAINAGTSPTAHRPNVTGASIPLPVESRKMLRLESMMTPPRDRCCPAAPSTERPDGLSLLHTHRSARNRAIRPPHGRCTPGGPGANQPLLGCDRRRDLGTFIS